MKTYGDQTFNITEFTIFVPFFILCTVSPFLVTERNYKSSIILLYGRLNRHNYILKFDHRKVSRKTDHSDHIV